MKVVDDEGRKFWIEVTVASLTVRTRFTILVWYMPTGKPKVLLLKLNRHPSGHTNRIERRNHTEPSKIDRNVPHIHCLTERYQVEAPGNVDVQLGYAEPTDRFDTIDEAVEFLIYEFGFYVADDPYDTAHPLFKDLEP